MFFEFRNNFSVVFVKLALGKLKLKSRNPLYLKSIGKI